MRRPRQTVARSRWVRLRVYIAASILGLALVAIGFKAYGIQVEDSDRYRRMAARQHLRTLEIPAPRGVLYDTRGRELAVTAFTDSVFASPHTVRDVTGTAEKLAAVLGQDLRALEDKLAQQRHFVWIERHVAPHQARAIEALKLPGVELTQEPRRYYPNRTLAGPLIGFANIDQVGLEGIERSMNDLLEGQKGELDALRDARGRVMLSDTDAGEVPGASVYLTVDRSVQFISEQVLADTLKTHEAKAGVAVVLEIGTGRVLAMASLPTYDPNRPAGAARRHARNRAITDAFEIGSPMKVFTMAAALEAGAVEPGQVFDVEKGRYRVGRKWIRDSHHDQELDLTGIIKRSSNVGAVKVAQALGADGLHDALDRYGFSHETEIELPGERTGLLRPTKRWGQIGLATASFGYGFTVTPLQVVAGFAAVAQRGIYYPPRLIRQVVDADGKVVYEHRPVGRRIIREDVAELLMPMIGAVFEKGRHGGTARHIDVVGYTAGGKTGTAHKVDPATGRYSDEMYLSSFVGVAPLDRPRIAVIVVIDEPRGDEYYGAKVAGPAFAEIVSETLRYLGVPENAPRADADDKGDGSDGGDEPAEPLEIGPGADALTEAVLARDDGVRAPDFRGMGMAEVLETARDAGIEVEVVGSGRAVSQTPEPGAPAKGATCRVRFAPGYR
jgi:cell division protein FtsI (penicillin-binding protein 3)